ncbi:MAG: undecaprenyldiphospho-muramoylpentapeptide beta-N-acetylglucosaminyltransferase [Rhodospirillaceae bacterium]|nr:undecaprenyldiphospho-muramoylpentapeptide beta-N-acetylglucosaminyltransferase [Rhodospirillaceae bacterium]
MSSRAIALAAGGTGGHIFPAQALARALLDRGLKPVLITDRRGSGYEAAFENIPVFRIHAGGIAGGGALGRLRGMAELALGTIEAERLLQRLRPVAAIGFGGYPSVPTMLAALRRGIPTLIHEQNAVIGRANRLLAGRVSRIATSFEAVRGLKPEHQAKIRLTGNPVRPAIVALRDMPMPSLHPEGERRIVVIGGSQGASVFGRVVPDAVSRLPEAMRARIRISQQCRKEDAARVACAYGRMGVRACISTFFEDMPRRLRDAHLVIARAGASTVAELAVAGRPAVLVPYPFATDDHQTANAAALDAAGGAWLMPEPVFGPKPLTDQLHDLLAHPVMLGTAAMCARASGRPDATERLAELAASLLPSNGNQDEIASTVAREAAA